MTVAAEVRTKAIEQQVHDMKNTAVHVRAGT
jgi:hypothetical protein